ncbi:MULTISPECIES: ABC transporter substrate-binding protein [Bosea]|jgi:peptide/nickel transport system substrate-binding protein|uniref:Peptide/nickel transport system substrate-binding protein n=1 Tax=Bosea robiniae TaxID=1036780 RepID=A0ABY0P719_9HYPH|nr:MULTISPECIES: ABC transporter substrate-binding protein [Bosea]TQI74496.1 peptide/nickel transport system substrate-binding protein [Bosea sp. AK1]SDH55262.1 peptide/nickel transport system substrate-binding protein [Bosea robiniae]
MTTTRRDALKAVAGSVALASLSIEGVLAQAGGKFVYANNSPYDNLDPHTIFDTARAASRFNLYDGLYRWVDNPPKMIPWLAESHTVSDDGKVYTFKLRQNAKFHDGKPLTSADVVYSIERILALKKGPASLYLASIKPGSTQAPDPHTVVFNLNAPSAIFLTTVPDILVVNSALVKANEKDGDWGEAWLARNEAGSGSYALRRHDPAVGFTARRFADHFAGWTGQPFDDLEFRTVLETNTRVLGLIRGDFQGADGYLPYDQIQRLRQSSNVQIIEQESMRVFILALNCTKPPMNNPNFRRALAYAFDYDGFIKSIMKDSVSRNPGPNPNNIWGTPPGLKGYSYNLDKAREELKKVTEPLRPITINALAGFSESEQAATLFQSTLRQIGVEVVVEVSPWSLVSTRMRKADTQADIVPLWKSTYYVDPNNWVGELYGTRYHGTRTFSYYSNPEFDKRLDRALVSADQDERRKLYEEMTQMVNDDAAGIFVYNTRWYGPYSSKVEGIRFSPVSNGQDIRWASLKR